MPICTVDAPKKWEGFGKSIIIIGGGACNEKLHGWIFLMLSTPSN